MEVQSRLPRSTREILTERAEQIADDFDEWFGEQLSFGYLWSLEGTPEEVEYLRGLALEILVGKLQDVSY